MPFLAPAAMTAAEPLPGWKGRVFHSEHMTFAHYDIAADAAALHEHHHVQEEVWHVVEGEIVFSIAGEERVLGPGDAAVILADTAHSARALKASRAVVVDYPLRPGLPGQGHHASVGLLVTLRREARDAGTAGQGRGTDGEAVGPEGIPEVFRGSRTPPSGDRRPGFPVKHHEKAH